MNGRTIAGVLLALLVVGGLAAIGISAYNAGVTAGLVEAGQVVVAPGQAVGPYVGGYGWGHGGFGFFGFLGFLFFLFLFFGLVRAAFGGGRGRGGWGPGGGGRYDRIREMHDELHRSGSTGTGATDPSSTDQPRS